MAALPAWLQHQLQPYGEARRDGRSLALWLEREVSDWEGLRRLALVILRPDCLWTGQALEVLESLPGRLLAFQLRRLSGRDFDLLYQFKNHLFGGKVWLHHQVFSGGPAALLVLRGNPDLAASIDARKGPSSALEVGDPEDLRVRFLRPSSFHAVVHASEDVAALAWEAPLFFNLPQLLQAEPLSPDYYRRMIDLPRNPRMTVFEAVMEVKSRLAWEIGHSQLTERTHQLWCGLSNLTYLQQRERVLEFAAWERGVLLELLEAPPMPLLCQGSAQQRWMQQNQQTARFRLVCATWWLTGQESYRLDDGQALFETLEANNVALPDWQKNLLRVGLANDLNVDSTMCGRPFYPDLAADQP